jgi:hypothetical protein
MFYPADLTDFCAHGNSHPLDETDYKETEKPRVQEDWDDCSEGRNCKIRFHNCHETMLILLNLFVILFMTT